MFQHADDECLARKLSLRQHGQFFCGPRIAKFGGEFCRIAGELLAPGLHVAEHVQRERLARHRREPTPDPRERMNDGSQKGPATPHQREHFCRRFTSCAQFFAVNQQPRRCFALVGVARVRQAHVGRGNGRQVNGAQHANHSPFEHFAFSFVH